MPSSSRQATPRRSRTSELLTARPLTAGEVALARHVFGEAIDYARATIARGKWAFFQPRRVVMAPSGCIHFHPRGTLYRDDFADAALTDQGLFIHEMTHIRSEEHTSELQSLMRTSYAVFCLPKNILNQQH